MITVTESLLESGISDNGSWSYKQLRLLGVKPPFRKGWKRRLIGLEITESNAKKFIDLKNAHLKDRSNLSKNRRIKDLEDRLSELEEIVAVLSEVMNDSQIDREYQEITSLK